MRYKLDALLHATQSQTLSEQKESALALFRITLQHLCIGLAEWIISAIRYSPNILLNLEADLNDLRSPSDGTLISILPQLLLAAENLGWTGISSRFWLPIKENRPAKRLMPTAVRVNIEELLKRFVELRNDGVEGHGLPGTVDSAALIDTVTLLIETFHDLLPRITDPSGDLVLDGPHGDTTPIKLLKTIHGDLTCYREIRRRPDGRCMVRAQRQTSLTSRADEAWEAEDLLDFNPQRRFSYRIVETDQNEWCPLVLFPDPLTAQFRGRSDQLKELLDWCDDITSRACMLFGDGGIGKTTLAVEFVHKLIRGELEVAWHPEMITFYTAKQTRWGLNGLEHIRSTSIGITDIAVHIFRALEGQHAGREWFDREPKAIIDRLATYLSNWGISRENHLIVLDNTETMARSETQVRELSEHIRLLTRRAGRVLLTSRRREPIEARQIQVTPLAVNDSIALLRARATELDRRSILQASDRRLANFANKLGNKPLLLEVYIQTLRDHPSLEQAFERVLQMEHRDLGEFLYADAWARFSERIQVLLLLMSRVADFHDETLLKLCCQEAEVPVVDAFEALYESQGIASVLQVDGQTQVSFSPDFLAYCEGREIRKEDNNYPPQEWTLRVRRRYEEFLESRAQRISDRISPAYKTPFARAAWRAFQEDRFEDCEFYYEAAVIEDKENGLLFDRYAYFLFSRKRYLEALGKAKEATRFAREEAETWFTRGMVEARLGFYRDADHSLNRAIALGKPEHLCYLQMVYGYLNSDPIRIQDAFFYLAKSERTTPKEFSHYVQKHNFELRNLRRRAEQILQSAKKK